MNENRTPSAFEHSVLTHRPTLLILSISTDNGIFIYFIVIDSVYVFKLTRFTKCPFFSTMGFEQDTVLVPPWLEQLLHTPFFNVCRIHADAARSECNMFCLDCNGEAFCFYCRSSRHKDHRVIQVGGYMLYICEFNYMKYIMFLKICEAVVY